MKKPTVDLIDRMQDIAVDVIAFVLITSLSILIGGFLAITLLMLFP